MKRILCAILSFLLLASPTASAISDNVIDHANSVETYYYNPEGSIKCLPSYATDIAVYGGAITEKIWTGLTSFLTPEQAAGILGNMQSESGFNPARHETSALNKYQPGFDLSRNNKVAYGLGLIQWSYSRRVRLYGFVQSRDPELLKYFDDYQTYGRLSGDEFLQKAGETDTDRLIAIEIEYLRDELSTAYSGFYATTSLEDATSYFLEHVEAPKNPTLSAHPERLTQAQSFYGSYSGKEITASTNDSGTPICTPSSSITSSGDAGALQALVLEYAWEQYHSPPFTERKSAYAAAIAKRQAEGKYVGGSVGGVAGIDCGGFVTTLMQESGFEPNYNAGKGGTSAQESWVKANGWTLLNYSPNTVIDPSILQPGDVAFTTGHTFVYVGDIPGFGSKIASASYSAKYGRAPMAGHESLTIGSGGAVRWYRKP